MTTAELAFETGFEFQPKHVGARTTRREDADLLVGGGQYVADIQLAGMVEAVFVRSEVAHGVIRNIDLTQVREDPRAIFAGVAADLDGVKPFPDFIVYQQPVAQFPLQRDRVRYVGTPIGVIVAEDRYVAEDLLDLVDVDIDELAPVTTIEQALASDAPLLYDGWASNKVLDFIVSKPEVDAAIAAGPSVSGSFTMQRQSPCSMETRGVVAEYRRGRLTVWSSCQSPHILRSTLAEVLDVAERNIHVIAPHVGGGFGQKTHQYPEEVVVPWLAMKLGRPVRWIEDRTEHMTSAVHARDQVTHLDASYDPSTGRITALRSHVVCDVGSGEIAMPGTCTSLVSTACLTAGLKIPVYATSTTCVVTNKTPSGAYRGFGGPEAIFAMSLLIDKIARAVGRTSADVQREMIYDPEDMPYLQPSGARIDSGSHRAGFERVVSNIDERLAKRRAEFAADRNVRVGSAACQYVEPTVPTYFGTTGHWTAQDASMIRIEPDGGALVTSGVTAFGQGTETAIAALVADALGMDVEDVTVVTGDTDSCPYGLGAWGSRGAVLIAGSVLKAAQIVRTKACQIAASLLEADEHDIVIADGGFHVRGTPSRSTSWRAVAQIATIRTLNLPSGMEAGLEATSFYDPPNLDHFPDASGRMNGAATWASGAQGAIVKVELNTGDLEILDYFSVHDCGPLINPPIVEGQVYGAIAQGLAGALYEEVRYSSDGQPTSTSFMDYAIPTAVEIPSIALEHFETPAPEMPLGLKGVAEGGTIGPAAVIACAVNDALAEFGVEISETPITARAVRRAFVIATAAAEEAR